MQTRLVRTSSPWAPWPDANEGGDASDDSDDGDDDCSLDGDNAALAVIFTRVSTVDALESSFRAELLRGDNGEGDCEGAELTSPPDPSNPPASLPPSSPISKTHTTSTPTTSKLQSPPPSKGFQSARNRAGKAARQRKRRQKLAEQYQAYDYKMRSSLSKKWSQPHVLKVKRGSLGFSSSSYTGRRITMPSRILWGLPSLKRLGFAVIGWDGL